MPARTMTPAAIPIQLALKPVSARSSLSCWFESSEESSVGSAGESEDWVGSAELLSSELGDEVGSSLVDSEGEAVGDSSGFSLGDSDGDSDGASGSIAAARPSGAGSTTSWALK